MRVFADENAVLAFYERRGLILYADFFGLFLRPLNGLFHVKQFFAELRCIQAQSISKACKSGINGKSEFQKQAANFGAMPLAAELKRLWHCVLAEECGGG